MKFKLFSKPNARAGAAPAANAPASGPSAEHLFLIASLAAVGLTEAEVTKAVADGKPDFLAGAIGEEVDRQRDEASLGARVSVAASFGLAAADAETPEKLAAAIRAKLAGPSADAELAQRKALAAELGLKPEDAATAASLKAAIESRQATAATKEAARQVAALGIAPKSAGTPAAAPAGDEGHRARIAAIQAREAASPRARAEASLNAELGKYARATGIAHLYPHAQWSEGASN